MIRKQVSMEKFKICVDILINEVLNLIQEIIGFSRCKLVFNTDNSDGAIVKLTDPSELRNLGWKCKFELEIKTMFNWYINNGRGEK